MSAPERLAAAQPPPPTEPAGAERPPPPHTRLLRRLRRPAIASLPLLACAALAWASLAVPAVLGYDPWVWLVWGRELVRGVPASDGSIAWKPLPVLVTTPLALFGDAAPELWTVVARTAGLVGLVAAFRLARRFAGPVAGALAVAAFLLTPDAEARWIRHLLQANIEPATVMLCLVAVERHLDDRRGQALLFLAAAGLTRPEIWPFLLVHAVYVVWHSPRLAWLAVPVLAAVPALWFGGDALVSGDPVAGATVARVLTGGPAERLLMAMDNAAGAVVAPVWVAAAVAVVWAAHRRVAAPVVLAAGALGWIAIVLVMAGAFGYAALGRFYAPAAAVLCVLAGIAVGWAVRATRPVVLRPLVLVALVGAAVPFAQARAQWLPVQVATAAEWAASDAELDPLIAAVGGRDAMLACGAVSIEAAGAALEVRPRLVWTLDVPLAVVRPNHDPGPVVAVVRSGGALDAGMAALPDVARPLARTGGWAAYAYQCPTPPR
ncbi:hypothetical protein [Pseudonocardia sp.]|uniref:hypothetical protein n=1 Tax=Pseudonocardia sp. TaxID=60912 RepID=UPI00262C1670|nr:hypothetical protein [Pseudonocardia sp.]